MRLGDGIFITIVEGDKVELRVRTDGEDVKYVGTSRSPVIQDLLIAIGNCTKTILENKYLYMD